jgi:hypothetical protein
MRSPLALRLFAAALSLAALAPDARACSVCACGDPLVLSSDPAAIDGRLRLQLDGEYLRVDAANDAVPENTDKLTQWSYRLNAVYRPLESLSVGATVPFLAKVIRTTGAGVDDKASDLKGVGDVELTGRWAFLRQVNLGRGRVHELALSGGTTAPTGKKDAVDAGGALVDPHGQVGTGAWSPFAGLHYRFETGKLTLYASLAWRWRLEARYFDGSRYKFGDALLYAVHGQWLLAHGLALDVGLDGRDARIDRATDVDGARAEVDNTGGKLLSAAPAVYWNATGALWIFARGQIPVWKSLAGRQDVLPSATLGLQVQVL